MKNIEITISYETFDELKREFREDINKLVKTSHIFKVDYSGKRIFIPKINAHLSYIVSKKTKLLQRDLYEQRIKDLTESNIDLHP